MGWTASNPVSIGEDTKKSEWDILWDNCDFTYIEPTTVMLFGQSVAPTGWTKKTNWADNSMLVYTTGAIGSGGSDDPISWITAISTQNENSHIHSMEGHMHPLPGGADIGSGGPSQISDDSGGPSVADTGAGSAHDHAVNQDTFASNYVKIIAATKDSGDWTAVNPVAAIGNAMKQNAHWAVLWMNIDFNYLASATVQFFGQSTAPAGWTKKTDWSDNSMLIYTTGNFATGGSDDPTSWTTAISTQDEDSHVHSMQGHTHGFGGGTPVSIQPGAGSYNSITGGPSTPNTGTGDAHSHGVNQDTFEPLYQKVIAATKDSGDWTEIDPVAVGYPTKKAQYDTGWHNIAFNYFAAATVMLFGQSAAPTGWTKKTNWTDNSMLVYTTGPIDSRDVGDDPTSWITAISIVNESSHVHLMPHTHPLPGGTTILSGTTYSDTTGGPSVANTGVGGTHSHSVSQDTMTLRYQEVIAATKDA